MAEMHSEPLEPEPDSTGVGMVKLIVFHSVMLCLLLHSYSVEIAIYYSLYLISYPPTCRIP
jgi:hypothetical protein